MADDSIVERRAKRQKIDKHGRMSAFEKLKSLKNKGVKNKYEMEDFEGVYDTVDEKEYTKKVLERQDDDWIVDDDGSGYVEDGREIFDDDLQDLSRGDDTSRKTKKKSKISKSDGSGKSNLRNCFANMALKRKITNQDVKIDDDNILNDILTELSDDKPDELKSGNKRKSTKLSKSFNIFDTSEQEAVNEYKKKLHSINKQLNKESEVQSNKVSEIQSNLNRNNDITNLNNTKKLMNKNSCDINKQKIETKLINKESDSKDKENLNLESVKVRDKISADIGNEEIDDDLDFNDCFDDDEFLDKTETDLSIPNKSEIINSKLDFADDDDEMFNAIDFEDSIFNEETCVKNEILMGNINTKDLLIQNAGQKVLKFFWWDALEDPFTPGVVYLFGKVPYKKSFLSCCVTVRNIERTLFILPRKFHFDFENNVLTDKPVAMFDVYNEFNNKFACGNQFRSRTVKKKYCFLLKHVPPVSEYLEVRLPASCGKLLNENSKGETFDQVFGTNTSFLELLILNRKLKGPSWLEIKNPEFNNTLGVTWCKLEVNCSDMANLINIDYTQAPPPMTLLSLNLTTVLNKRNMENEIVFFTALVHERFPVDGPAPNPPFTKKICGVTKPEKLIWTKNQNECLNSFKWVQIEKCSTETDLLKFLVKLFEQTDVDVIVGHDLIGYQLDILYKRLRDLKIPNWSVLGKLKRKQMSRSKNIAMDLFGGRLICDLKISAQELIKARSYDLENLCATILKKTQTVIKSEEVEHLYETVDGLKKLIPSKFQDCFYILKMCCQLNAIPLAMQITNCTGFIMSRTLLGGRAERNEYLLLHAFTQNGFIVPDKYSMKLDVKNDELETTGGKKKAKYLGGLVLEPKVNFYETYVLLMDFNSLYPSIIQEYNICFTTINSNGDKITDFYELNVNCSLGILPIEIQRLVTSRRQVKNRMKDLRISKEQLEQLNIKQLALKLTANSMYGCLGYGRSRFFAQHLAAKVTELGRDILTNTKQLVERMCHNVIYGDTDSLMILTQYKDYDSVIKVGNEIKKAVNKLYRFIELDIDGVFKYLLLLKKKKYAAVTIQKKGDKIVYEQEIKGLDIIRRDWCQLAAEAGKFILNNILSDLSEDEKIKNIFEHLTNIKLDLEANRVPVSLLSISKQLTRDPTSYANKNSLPHVLVALRYNQNNAKSLRQGDTVYYVICEDNTKNSAMQRAYHVEEYKNADDSLKVDVKYYISQQIYPLVQRLIEPVQFINKEQLATVLGMDLKHVKNSESIGLSPLESDCQFVNCETFKFNCQKCACVNEISSTYINGVKGIVSLERCSNPNCSESLLTNYKYIGNKLVQFIESFIRNFYESAIVCADSACGVQVDHVIKDQKTFNLQCNVCKQSTVRKEYTEKDLNAQLVYLHNLFKLKNYRTDEIRHVYEHLKSIVLKYLHRSEYNFINLKDKFEVFKNWELEEAKTQELLDLNEYEFIFDDEF